MTSQELATLVSERANAAQAYYAEVQKNLEPLVDQLCELSKDKHCCGRVFLKITLQEKDDNPGINYRHVDFSSQVGRGFMTANAAEPGEFRVSIDYQYAEKKTKHLTWYFPKEGAASPQSVAEFIVQSLVAPTDNQFE